MCCACQTKCLLTVDLFKPKMLGMKDTEIIKALGGYEIIADALKLSKENAAHLEKRPTPWKHRAAIKSLARRKRISVPADYMEVRR